MAAERPMTIKEVVDERRAEIERIKKAVFATMKHAYFWADQSHGTENSEMKANIMLAYRHLEDARMRLGKVLQAQSGGVSIYDDGRKVGAIKVPQKEKN